MRGVVWFLASSSLIFGTGMLAAGPVTAGGFTGPVFGIATAPNGDILAADAATGIAKFSNGQVTLDASFPGISDLSPIGRGASWAVRGAEDGSQGSDVGQGLYRVTRGKTRKLVNLFEYEVANDPVPPPPGGGPESNPFDVQALGGEFALVVDAAANDLLRIDDEGQVELIATFPYELVSTANLKALLGCPGSGAGPCFAPDMLPAQPVPTSVAVGADGYYYVGELKGFPAPQNESRIWRIAPWAAGVSCGSDPGCELVFDGGFTSIIDLAFGPDGLLYVVELDENSWFAITLPGPQPLAGGTINACDLDTLVCVERAAGLVLPTAITFGKDGTLWSTEFGPAAGMATIVKIP